MTLDSSVRRVYFHFLWSIDSVQFRLTKSKHWDLFYFSLQDIKGEASEKRIFYSTQCSCWCTGWAEVKIRGASGVISWMMRIENESSSYSINTDPLFPDITQLLAPVRCRFVFKQLHSINKLEEKEMKRCLYVSFLFIMQSFFVFQGKKKFKESNELV